MKHHLLISLAFVMANITTYAQTGVITVHHPNGSDDFYYMPGATLNSVLALAGPDDIIHLPGGTIPFTNMVLNTRVTIVGAGFHQNGVPVTQKTVIPSVTFGFDIGPGANGSSFHGIDFESSVELTSGVQQISFTRCEFYTISMDPVGPNDPVGVQFKQCLLRFGISAGTSAGLTLDNCVLESGLSFNFEANNNFIRHCLFLNANLSGGVAPSITYTDNIFVFASASPSISNPGQFFNNVFALPNGNPPNYSGSGVYSGNQTALSSNLFPTGTSLTTYDYTDNYAPNPGTVPLTMVTNDGTQAGIYGGLPGSPWKPFAIPYNPHWEHLAVPPATTGGVLQGVQIQGSAQSN